VLPKLVRLVESDEQFITALARELQIFNFFIERVMEKIRATYEVPVPQGGLALKAAFRAGLETVPGARKLDFSLPGIGLTVRLNTNAPTIPYTNARLPYPSHRSAHQA
jgi:hypothetical protein